jgi:hypothetical protein
MSAQLLSRGQPRRTKRASSTAKAAPVRPAPSAPEQQVGADLTALALALVDAGATTKPATTVASILDAHAGGAALNRIATDLGIHHKTVSKIIAAATKRQREMQPVG